MALGIFQQLTLPVTRRIHRNQLYVLLLALAAQFDAAGGFIPAEFFGAKGNGTTDDSGAVQFGYNLLKGTGIGIVFGNRTYLFKVGINMGTGDAVPIKLSSGTTLLANLVTNVGDVTGILFFCPVTTGPVTTLAAAVNFGDESMTLTSAAAFATGTRWFVLSTDGANGMQYTADSVAGAVVKADRAVTRTFPNASAVTVITGTTDHFRLYGNGGRITGPCFRYGELDHVRDAYVEWVNFDDSQGYATTGAWSFDTASFRVRMFRCTFSGPSGVACESNEDAQFIECVGNLHGAAPVGGSPFSMSDCTGSQIVRCQGTRWTGASNAGAIFTTQGALGCLDCEILGCEFVDNTNNVIVHTGARIRITDCTLGKAGSGAAVNADAVTGLTIHGCDLNGATNVVVSIATSTETEIIACDMTGWLNIGIDAISNITCVGVRGQTGVLVGPAAVGIRATSCTANVMGCDLTVAGAVPGAVTPSLYVSAGTALYRCSRSSGHLSGNPCAAGQVAFAPLSTSVLTIDDCDVDDPSGAGVTKFVFSGSATSTTRHRWLRYPAAGFTDAIAGNSSRGSSVLVAGTVVVAWPDLKKDDLVRAQLKTAGGALGQLSTVRTSGTGFTINSSNAGDTSTIEWEVT